MKCSYYALFKFSCCPEAAHSTQGNLSYKPPEQPDGRDEHGEVCEGSKHGKPCAHGLSVYCALHMHMCSPA